MTRWMLTAAAVAASGLAFAKLQPPDDAAKAAAAAAAAKAAWQGKVDAYQLCKVQDRIAAKYKSSHPDAAKAAASAPGATAAPVTAAASATATAAPTSKVAAPASSAASGAQGTPVAAAGPTPSIPSCNDPGPYAAAPPEQKPLESSEAHSPAATATSPPSVRAESGTMTSGKGGGAAPGPGKK